MNRAELVRLLRFGLIGVQATALHIFILWLLLSKTFTPVLLANAIAFAGSFSVSFAGNYLWTFASPDSSRSLRSPRRAVLRFLVVSVAAFIANNSLLLTLLELGWFDPLPAAIGTALLVPFLTFFASRYWAFRPLPAEDTPQAADNTPANEWT
jgi:putative flippase GtrA